MTRQRNNPCTGSIHPASVSRRELLWRLGGGLGGVALASLLGEDQALASGGNLQSTIDNPRPHFRPKAKRVVQLYMSGAASQCDTFDYKPLLIQRAGQKFEPGGKIELFQSDPGVVMKSPWAWKQHGQSGRWVSSLLPHLSSCADELAVVYSMMSKSNVHGPATFMQATGFVLPGFPSMGAWVVYGLGRMTDDLPSFVVLPDPRGYAPNGPANWSSGFLPAANQGVMVKVGSENPIAGLRPPPNNYITQDGEADGLKLLRSLNHQHVQEHPGDSRLDARIQSYELAARLQLSAPEVLDISKETAATKRLYGIDEKITEDMGTRCLVARRMLERGVRFVQIWSGADNGFPRRNWDSHEDLERDHYDMGTSMDKPAAALIKDLKSRGMLEDTIVLWTTEFGRMPCSQGGKGRDHNP